MIPIILILLTVYWAYPAFGETFQWVDDCGGVHFVDDFTKIPEKYQPSSLKVETEGQDRKVSTEENQVKGNDGNVRDRLGRGEDYWKERVAETKNRIKLLLDKSEDLRVKYNELATRYNDSKSSVERAAIRNEREQVRQEMEKNRSEIEETRNILEKKIPEEADLYKAKPEWIK